MTEQNDSDEQHYKNIAKAAAIYVAEGYFSSRRGILPSDRHITVLYDNNPRTESPLPTHQLNAVAHLIEMSGGVKLAEASYPANGGPDDGYTLVMIFEGEWSKVVQQHDETEEDDA